MPVELIVAAAVAAPYDLVGNTVSDLGAVGCGAVTYPSGPVPVCSPGHAVINGSFVVFGVLPAAGAVLRRTLPPGEAPDDRPRAPGGLRPEFRGDRPRPAGRRSDDHLVVSTPVFLAQPVALLLTGVALRSRTAIALGALSAAAALVFLPGVVVGTEGLLERLALWPGYLVVGVLGHRVLTNPTGGASP